MGARIRCLGLALTLAMAAGLAAGEARAAAQRTFVASYGSDAEPCSLARPCRSFGAAIASTVPSGEVIALDSAGYGSTVISKPVSIIAPPGIYASVSVTSGAGIVVDAGSGSVALRGLTINGNGGTTGIEFTSGAALYLDDVTVSRFPSAGLSVGLAAGGSAHITRSTFHDNGTGVVLGTAAGTLNVAIEGSLFARNGVGLSFRDGAVGYVHASTVSGGTTGILVAPPTPTRGSTIEVRNCTIFGTAAAAIDAVQSGAGQPLTLVSVVGSLVSGKLTGLRVAGANSSVYVSDSTLTRLATGVSAVAGGAVVSGGDNRLFSNAADGAFASTASKQ
jgi:hypothetical protein